MEANDWLEMDVENFERNFNKRECCNFIPMPNRLDTCQCNRPAKWHTARGISAPTQPEVAVSSSAGNAWQPKTCTKAEKTDAYGLVKFEQTEFVRQSHMPRYIRLDSLETEQQLLWQLLTHAWGLPRPQLMVSIFGGAKKMRPMADKMVRRLRQGIINIATRTKTWLLTGGFDLGSTRLVGEAVRDHQLAGGSADDVVLIGICAWGTVLNREKLLMCNSIERTDLGLHVASYPIVESKVKGQACLEPHHTHFLLCDDGTRSNYNSALEFVDKFESHALTEMQATTGVESNVVTPRVLVVIEGGRKDVQAALMSAKNGSPVVAVKGSGRAANLIAEACESDGMDSASASASALEYFGSELSEDSPAFAQLVDSLLQLEQHYKHMLNVYDAESLDPDEQLDRVILQAILRQPALDAVVQLKLAMAWNRPDVAAKLIFSADNKTKWEQLTSAELERCLYRALLGNQVEFVELLLDHGVNVTRLLSRGKLADLYAAMLNQQDPQMMRTKERLDYLSLTWSDWIFSSGSSSVAAPTKTETQRKYQERLLTTIGEYVSVHSTRTLKNFYPRPETEAYLPEDLLLWAILMGRTEIAMLLWRQSTDNISSALVCAALLRSLHSSYYSEGSLEFGQRLGAAADKFELAAVEVLRLCYRQNRKKTLDLLVRAVPIWNGQTLLSLAELGNCMEFMVQPAVQHKVSDIWIAGSKTYLPLWRTFAAMLLPPLIPKLVFDTAAAADTHAFDWRKQSLAGPITPVHPRQVTSNPSPNSRAQPWKFVSQFTEFYTSPQVKFITTVASSLAFLLLFSYVLLVSLRHRDQSTEEDRQPNFIEIALLVWTFSFIFEEFGQIFLKNKINAWENLKDWFRNMWDLFDLFLTLMLVACIATRLTVPAEHFVWVRMTYALTLTFFYIRFMQYYLIHQDLGPKVIMVTRMFADIIFFLALLAIFVFGYGVSAQALMYPNSPLSWKLLKDIVYLPYWQMYGELELDQLDGGGDDDEAAGVVANLTEENAGPVHSPMVIGMFAIYMLITNVLLLNLLIAMFGYTFEQVRVGALKFWSFHRYKLIREFYHRPFLPHPLASLAYLVMPIAAAIRRRRRKIDTKFVRRLDASSNASLSAFVHQCTDRYLAVHFRRHFAGGSGVGSEEADESKSMSTVSDKIDLLGSQIETLASRQTTRLRPATAKFPVDSTDRHHRQFVDLSSRLTSTEEKLDTLISAVDSLTRRRKSKKSSSSSRRRRRIRNEEEEEEELRNEAASLLRGHSVS